MKDSRPEAVQRKADVLRDGESSAGGPVARPRDPRTATTGTTRPADRRPGWGGRLRDLLLVLVLFALGSGVATAYATLRIWQVGGHDGRHAADAIVVLGTAQYNGRPSPALQARLDHAIALYLEGDAPWFITTGGNQPGDWTTEAEVGRKYAIAHGVPAAAILYENKGGTTYESMVSVRAIMAAHGLRSALFVSDRSHMLRVLLLAKDQGIVAWSSPTETSPDDALGAWGKAALHEIGALAQYLLTQQDVRDPDLPADATPAVPASSAASATASPRP
jgi:uncharacterized SAM-binding protein YcdF (DUF218 family)